MNEEGSLSRATRSGWTSLDWIILLAVTLFAAALRFYHLGVTPPGFQFDEAFNALDAAAVLEGQRPLFLPLNGGREVAYTYLQAALASIWGLNVTTLRLASALAGISTVPATYLLLRGMLRVNGQAVAALTSLALAGSFWHLHFSHYGIRVILMPLIFSGVCGLFWLGCRREKMWYFAVSGALVGLGIWTHPTGRLMPFVLIAYTAWLYWTARRRGDGSGVVPVKGLLVSGLVGFLVFLPLGVEFYRHPDFFFGHPGQVSVFADRVSAGSPARALLDHLLATLGMFNVRGDQAWIHNLAGRPVFDVIMGLVFLLGVYLWLRRLARREDPDRDALVLLLIWAVVMMTPTVLSDDAPNFSRSLPAVPAIFLPVGLGLGVIAGLFGLDGEPPPANVIGQSRRLAGGVAVVLILAGSIGMAVYDYFVRFPARPETYYAYDGDKLDAWRNLLGLPDDTQIYLSQLWADHGSIMFLRRGSRIKSFDSSNTVVLPGGDRNAAYAFPALQAQRAESYAGLWPAAQLQRTTDAQGKPLLDIVRVPASGLVDWPPALQPDRAAPVSFDGGPDLAGMRSGSDWLQIFWKADEPNLRSLTTFVHVVDGNGQRVGQIDRIPGDGSYPTTEWSQGERVVERFFPEVAACRDGEPLQVIVGWYDAGAGGTRLARTDGTGDTALAGQADFPLRSGPLESLLPGGERPASLRKVDLALTEELVLSAYEISSRDQDLQPRPYQPGAPLLLDLYLVGEPSGADFVLSLRPAGSAAAEALPIYEGPLVPPGTEWRAGEAICRRMMLHLPADLEPGTYRLEAKLNGGESVALGEVDLVPSTRRFDKPPVSRASGATLGEKVTLIGAEVGEPSDGTLPVTLVWEALASPGESWKVFLHLVDSTGDIVAQSDALPVSEDRSEADAYPTDHWLQGEIVLDRHNLSLPADSDAGPFRLLAGMYDPVTGRRLPAQDRDGRPIAGAAVPLGEVEIHR